MDKGHPKFARSNLKETVMSLTTYKNRAERLHEDLREVWTIVSEQPGITLEQISQKMGCSKSKVFKLVGMLKKSGTLVAGGDRKYGTLQATVPMVRVKPKS